MNTFGYKTVLRCNCNHSGRSHAGTNSVKNVEYISRCNINAGKHAGLMLVNMQRGFWDM